MPQRRRADYIAIAQLLSQRIQPTADAALDDLTDITDDNELASGVIRNLVAAQRELGKASKSINLAICACRLEDN